MYANGQDCCCKFYGITLGDIMGYDGRLCESCIMKEEHKMKHSVPFKLKNKKCKCGNDTFYTAERGPHIGIYCESCHRFLKWASKGELRYINVVMDDLLA